MKPWVVLGASGFLGGVVSRALRDAGYTVYALPHAHAHTLCEYDIAGVVNCAGINRGADDEVRNSCLFPVTLPVAPRMIHMSSERVYGWLEHPTALPGRPDPKFGEWKLDAEKALAARYPNGRLCILRVANAYGHGARPYYNSVIATWVHEALSGKPMKLDPGRRSFVYARDIGKIVVALAGADSWEPVLDVRGVSASLEEVAAMIAGMTGGTVEYTGNEPTVSAPSAWWSQAKDACALIGGYTPLEIGLVETLRDARASLDCRVQVQPRKVDKRGWLSEVCGWAPARVYCVGVNPGYERGGHYHEMQRESLFVAEGEVRLEVATHEGYGTTAFTLAPFSSVEVGPRVAHWLWNPSPSRGATVVACSTQEYVDGESPDTFKATRR